MPINADLLERIKKNDPTLKRLDLNNQELNDNDVRQLVNALVTNTVLTTLNVKKNELGAEGAKALATNSTLTSLDVSYNQLGDEGAKALATNSTLTLLDLEFNQLGAEGAKALAANSTLTTLDLDSNQLGDEGAKALAANSTLTSLKIGHNQIGIEGAKALAANSTLTSLHVENNRIGDEGAKALATNATLTELNVYGNQIGAEGAKALAANSTLTSLHVYANQIGNEGAKALAANSTLTELHVWHNHIGDETMKQLKQAIARNNQQLISRRNQFIRALMILAYDKANSASQSLWSRLPQELMVHIISLMDFRGESIGKNAQQIKHFATFMFTHVADLKRSIKEAIKTQRCVKIMEKHVQGKSQFQFFPPPSFIRTEKENQENPNKIRKTL